MIIVDLYPVRGGVIVNFGVSTYFPFLFWNKLMNLASNFKEETKGKEGA